MYTMYLTHAHPILLSQAPSTPRTFLPTPAYVHVCFKLFFKNSPFSLIRVAYVGPT